MPIASRKIIDAFDSVAAAKPTHFYNRSVLVEGAGAWLVEALALVEGTFGPEHATSRTMSAAVEYVLSRAVFGADFRNHYARQAAAVSCFDAAHALVSSGALDGLIDLVRAETESELLDQAAALLATAPAAATVIAGGALETHLRRIVERHQIPLPSDPSLNVYNDAIASFRKKNPSLPLYAPATGDLIRGWTKMRNDAAHTPIPFAKDTRREAIQQMIDGIRLLIA